jgi:non-ribosomal peptide synthetase component F
MIVGLLAILKAGGAYVPLDAAYPKERLAFMVEDANISVLLTHGDLVENLPVAVPLTICVDRDKSAIGQLSAENPSNQATPDNLAYVIYTSGSTGRPKGVQISHRALANFQCAMRRRPGVTAQDKVVAVTTLSFDIAGFEIYPTLCAGACILVVSREEASDDVE